MKKTGISRRDFLKNAGAVVGGAAAGAGLMGLSGCATTGAASAKNVKWNKTVDVVVVGAGCGLAAAIEAKKGGADVVILEKNDFVGGLYITAGGQSIWGGTKIQKQFGIEDSKEAWLEDELYGCHFRGVPELIKTYVDRTDDTLEWFESLGMVWRLATNGNPETHRVNRSHFPAASDNYPDSGSVGHAYTAVMEKKVRELNIPILFKHRMTKVYRDGDGPVTGVEVQTDSGIINIKARKAVILCTGTWTDNERMAALYDPRIVGEDTYGDGGIPADGTLFVDSAGDGHVAAAEIGAAFTDMSFVAYLYIFFGSRSYWGCDPFDFSKSSNIQPGKGILRNKDFYQNIVLVKQDGRRYIDESLGAQSSLPWAENRKLIIPQSGALTENIEWPFTQKYLSLPQPRNVWAVVDSATAAALRWPIDALKNPNPKRGQMFDPACIAIADTLDDLAKQMKIDAATLKQTIDRYNSFADSGTDADFGKKGPMRKVSAAPFYGLKASLIRHTQRNGARVNTKSQVIAALQPGDGRIPPASINDEKVIPHLYAAGELGNVMAWRRSHGSLGNYAIFARIAGENACKETPIN